MRYHERMIDFDIHALDSLKPGHDKADKAFDRYRRELMDLFAASLEGQTCAAKQGSAGSWAGCLLDFAFNYLGVTLPNMAASDLQEILSDYFPRKLSLRSPDEAEDIMPELIAFWRFLGREFALDAAEEALRYLGKTQPSFIRMMNDPSKFGMAKSFFMRGHAAGFDMTDQNQMRMFIAAYNARAAAELGGSPTTPSPRSELLGGDPGVKRDRARSLRKKIAAISKKHPRKKRR
jgi:hypothetical protein